MYAKPKGKSNYYLNTCLPATQCTSCLTCMQRHVNAFTSTWANETAALSRFIVRLLIGEPLLTGKARARKEESPDRAGRGASQGRKEAA